MPVMDEGGFILDYISPPGTSLAETDRLLRQVESDSTGNSRSADLFAAHWLAARRRRH